jgi:hypothetical protein
MMACTTEIRFKRIFSVKAVLTNLIFTAMALLFRKAMYGNPTNPAVSKRWFQIPKNTVLGKEPKTDLSGTVNAETGCRQVLKVKQITFMLNNKIN